MARHSCSFLSSGASVLAFFSLHGLVGHSQHSYHHLHTVRFHQPRIIVADIHNVCLVDWIRATDMTSGTVN